MQLETFTSRVWTSAAALALMACATPRLYAPVPALLHADPADNPEARVLISLNGRGFGAAQVGTFRAARCGRRDAGAFVRIHDAAGRTLLEAGSTDPARVVLWSDVQIVLSVPEPLVAAPALRADVCIPGGMSRSAPLELWQYDHFDVPRPDPGSNPSPGALAVDGESGVWVNEEFHTQVKRLSARREWTVLDIPQAPGPGIFALNLFGDQPSRIATFGEDILVDPHGRVWLSETGIAPYSGAQRNHARILRIDPGAAEPVVYNVPGDNNGVIGIAFDPATERVWFTQARRALGEDGRVYVAQEARLTSFDPRRIEPDPRFDFVPVEQCVHAADERVGRCSVTSHRRCLDDDDCVLASQICAPDSREDTACFREHELPAEFAVTLPAHVLRHSDGTFWYAAYWGGNHIGRFDPARGIFQRFPLPRPPGESSCPAQEAGCCFQDAAAPPRCPARCCLYQLIGRGPWQLVEEASGDVAFASQEAGSVSRFSYARRDDPRCLNLERGVNPCIADHPIPNLDPTRQQMPALARDPAGNLWFAQAQGLDGDPHARSSLGFLQAGTRRAIVFAPLSLYPFTSTGLECGAAGAFVGFHGSGVAVDPRTSAVWFGDYCRRRLGRLVRR